MKAILKATGEVIDVTRNPWIHTAGGRRYQKGH